MNKIKRHHPPIKYFGGKNLMFNRIIEHFPNPEEYDLYIEPFAGSYGIGLKLDPIPKMEIYNDLDKNVYTLYKVLQDENMFNEFKKLCDLSYYSEDIREELRYKLRDDDLSLVERAYAFFYVNRTSHNGIGGFSINKVVRRNMSKSVSDYLSAVDRLPELHNRLSRLIVTNKDGVELIKNNSNERTLIYADPPYEHSTRTLARYDVDMNRDKHMEFLDVVINSKSKIVVSGYDNELYDILEENGFTKTHFEVNTVSGQRKPKTKIETLWKNF